MTFQDLVQHLANDLCVKEISIQEKITERHVQRKIRSLKKRCDVKTTWGAVAKYLRKNIIE
jgi:hypothetical protein